MYNAKLVNGMRPADFISKYPRLSAKIMRMYSAYKRKNEYFKINEWLQGNKPRSCELCNKLLNYPDANQKPPKRCVKCANINLATAVTYDQFIAKWNKPPQYQLLTPQWERHLALVKNVTFFCTIHNRNTTTSIGRILNGAGCLHCRPSNQSIFFDEWAKRSAEAHNNKYDYSLSTDYKGTNYDVTIVCPIHGPRTQNAGVHMRGHGCKACATNYELRYETDEFIKKAIFKHGLKYDYSKTVYSGARNEVTITCATHGDFNQVAYYHLAGNGCQQCGLETCTYKSKPEYEIIEFLTKAGINEIDITHSSQKYNFELDILLQNHNIAIEYDGVYWHSSPSKDLDWKHRDTHIRKTNICEENNVQLFHIFENEWLDPIKQKIWKSVLLHKLGLSVHKVFARKTKIVLLTAQTARTFFDDNHLQGFAAGSHYIGLEYNGTIVFAAIFGKSRFRNKSNCYEIIRAASLMHYNVVGGFSKLVKHFCREVKSGTLVSYANRRWSTGNAYNAMGFKLVEIGGPCYFYLSPKLDAMYHRSKFMKHKLADILPNFDASKSEAENMYDHRYRRIWDCGNLVYELEIECIS